MKGTAFFLIVQFICFDLWASPYIEVGSGLYSYATSSGLKQPEVNEECYRSLGINESILFSPAEDHFYSLFYQDDVHFVVLHDVKTDCIVVEKRTLTEINSREVVISLLGDNESNHYKMIWNSVSQNKKFVLIKYSSNELRRVKACRYLWIDLCQGKFFDFDKKQLADIHRQKSVEEGDACNYPISEGFDTSDLAVSNNGEIYTLSPESLVAFEITGSMNGIQRVRSWLCGNRILTQWNAKDARGHHRFHYFSDELIVAEFISSRRSCSECKSKRALRVLFRQGDDVWESRHLCLLQKQKITAVTINKESEIIIALWDGNKGEIQRLPLLGRGMDITQCEYPPLRAAVMPPWRSSDRFTTEWNIRQFDSAETGLCAIGSRKEDLQDHIILFDKNYDDAASFPCPLRGCLKISHGYVRGDHYILFHDHPGQLQRATVKMVSGIFQPESSTVFTQDYLTRLQTVRYNGCSFPVAVTQPANFDIVSSPRFVFLSAYGCFGHQAYTTHSSDPVELEVLKKGGMVARVWLPPVLAKASDIERRSGENIYKPTEKLIESFAAVMQGLQTEYGVPVIVGGYGMSSIIAAASINRQGCSGAILLMPLLEQKPLAQVMNRFPFLCLDVAEQLRGLARPYACQYPPTLVWRAQGKPGWTAEVARSDQSTHSHFCFYLQAGFSTYLHQGYYNIARSVVSAFLDQLPVLDFGGDYLPGVTVQGGEWREGEEETAQSDSEPEDSYESCQVARSSPEDDLPEQKTASSAVSDQSEPGASPVEPSPKVYIKTPVELLQEFHDLYGLHEDVKDELKQLEGMKNGIETRTEAGLTLMHLAARSGLLEPAISLAKNGADTFARDFKGNTPLHMAARYGQFRFVSWLLSKDSEAHLYSKSCYETAPLTKRSQQPLSVETDQRCLSDVKNIHGRTPLFYAVRDPENCFDMVRLLVRLGANPDCKDKFRVSPKGLAERRGKKELEPHFKEVTPYDIRLACMTRDVDAVKEWQSMMNIDDLKAALNNVVDFKLKAKPSALAFKHGNPEFFKKILELGADPDVCYPGSKMKIIHKSVELGRPDLVKIIAAHLGNNEIRECLKFICKYEKSDDLNLSVATLNQCVCALFEEDRTRNELLFDNPYCLGVLIKNGCFVINEQNNELRTCLIECLGTCQTKDRAKVILKGLSNGLHEFKPGSINPVDAALPATAAVLGALSPEVKIFIECPELLEELAAHDLFQDELESVQCVGIQLKRQCDDWVQSGHSLVSHHLGCALHRAASCRANASACYLLQKGANPGFGMPKTNETPLHQVARTGNVELMKVMIDQYSALEKQPEQGIWQNNMRAIQYAAGSGHIDIIRLLVERGVSPECKPTLEEHTILHFAVMGGHADMVDQMLQEKMLYVDVVNRAACTPLYYAVADKRLAVRRKLVEVLLKHGANPQLEGRSRVSPLQHACNLKHYDAVRQILKLDYHQLVLDCRQDADDKIKLLYSEIKRPELQRRLLRVPFDDKCKSSLIHMAVQYRAYKTIGMLKELGASRKVQSGYPDSPEIACYPIHLAASMGDIKAAELLIKRPGDLLFKDGIGRTVQQVANDHGQREFSSWLTRVYSSGIENILPL
ncbi:ankyrin repeat domain-containing protein [Endozoicomonadaceae bacterium StTr2]